MSAHVERLDPRQLFAAGAADSSFGNEGGVRMRFAVPAGQSAAAYQVAVDSVGRTYVVAELTGGETTLPQSYQIQRLTADGVVDRTWAAAKHGRLKFDWSKHTEPAYVNPASVVISTDSRFRVAIDPADRLIVLDGNTLYRCRTNGEIDTSFGDNGEVTLAKFRYTNDVTVDPANRITVAGTTVVDKQPRMAVTRVKAGGLFDPKFGKKGLYTAPDFGTRFDTSDVDGYYARRSFGQYLRRLDDGSIVLAGDGASVFHYADAVSSYDGQTYEIQGIQAVKLTARGRPDTGYGKKGVAESLGFNGMVSYNEIYTGVCGIRPDGAVVGNTFNSLSDGDTDATAERNNLLIAGKDGRVTDSTLISFDPTAADEYHNAVSRVDFVGPAAGPYVTLSIGASRNLFRQTAGGRFDKTFNGGTPIVAEAIAAGPLDTIVTATSTRFADRLSVGRVLLS